MLRRVHIRARHKAKHITAVRNAASECDSDLKSRDANEDEQRDDEPTPQQPIPTHTFRYREHGNKALPLSSFLDPFRLKQRHQHRNRASKPAPPTYEKLSEFRQKLACNPYAKLLAQPVRPCLLTEASLPQSLLLNLNTLRDPTPPHARTLVPLSLHNESLHGNGDGGAAEFKKERGKGCSISLNKRILHYLAQYYDKTKSTKGGGGGVLRIDAKVPPNIVPTVHELMAKIVMTGLRWPLERGSKDLVSLPEGLAGLSSCRDPAVVLFFGGRVYSEKMAMLEARVDAILLKGDTSVHKARLTRQTHYGEGPVTWALKRADPRVMYPPVGLSTVQYTSHTSDGEQTYAVPVIPMIDLLGEHQAQALLRDTKHEGAEFVAVRTSPATADTTARLLSCALWMKDGYVESIKTAEIQRSYDDQEED